MPDDYISREAAQLAIKAAARGASVAAGMRLEAALKEITQTPAADVAPVAHGKWERKHSNWYCTNCRKGYRITNGAPAANTFHYCPSCGARMDGGEADGR